MGTLLVVVIGLAILSFVLADILGPGSSLFGGQDNSVGEIAGVTINLQEYQTAVDVMTEKFALRNGRRPSDAEQNNIREQAWEKLISDIAFSEQFNELGIQVTKDEEFDIVQGQNIHPDLVAAFTDPQTGTFDPSAISNFLVNLNQFPPQTQQAWYSLEEDIISGRRRVKYDNLLIKSSFATLEESKRAYQHQTEVAELRYLYVPYYAVADSAVTVSDSELSTYISEHSAEYQTEESRSLKYVSFPVQISAEDSAAFQEEMRAMKDEFAQRSDDSLYATARTDVGAGFVKYAIDRLPLVLQSDYENLQQGSIYGPFIENGYHSLYKISEVTEDTIYAARAKHILFKWEDNSIEAKEEAKSNAQDVLRELRNGADFAEKALQHGTDGTASQGGDLGWFSSGAMVPAFEQAVFDATQPGLLSDVVETDFGYHIISVTDVKNNTAFKIATVNRLMTPSQKSRDIAYRQADIFRGNSEDLTSFEANATEAAINIYDAADVDKNARRFGSLGNARNIVSWLYRDADVGSVSDVYEIDDNYVIAVMTAEKKEGTASLEDVRNEVSLKVKNQKKAQVIIDRLNGASGDLDQKATEFGSDASVFNTSDLKFSSNSLPNVGFAPEAVGRAFALEAGETTGPLSSENGVLIIEMIGKSPAPEIADYAQYAQQLKQQAENRTSFNIANAIKEFSDIDDRRYKFF